LAYACCGLSLFSTPVEKKKTEVKKESAWFYLIFYSLSGLTGNLLCNIGFFFLFLNFKGMSYAGSGIFQVLFSSSLIFTALISFVVNKKRTTVTQFLGILTIVLGLSLTAIPNFLSPQKGNEKFTLGIILSLVGKFEFF
jgi:drug/metabolite transporter (DMT)-like permease